MERDTIRNIIGARARDGVAALAAALALGAAAGCAAPVDQEQLGVTGGLGIGPAGSIGQTFTAGCTGPLVGVEVSLVVGDAGYTYPDPVMEVSGPSGSLGNKTIPAATVPVDLAPLAHDAVGPGYFDLTSLAIAVTAGESYAFDFLGNPAMAGTCDVGAGSCASGRVGQSCSVDGECDLLFFVGDTGDGDPNPGDPYAGGSERIGTWERAGYDLGFKTFVTGCTP